MNSHLTSAIKIAFLLMIGGAICHSPASAQFPSILANKDSSRIFVTGYIQPYAHYFVFGSNEVKFGISPGINAGYCFSKRFHLQSGLEFSSVYREVDDRQWGGSLNFYRSFFYEFPMEAKFRAMTDVEEKNQLFFTFGAGIQFAVVSASNDPWVSTDRFMYHQSMIRAGFEHIFRKNQSFSFVWGLNAKSNPLSVMDEEYSIINGAYSAGAKFGILFGL